MCPANSHRTLLPAMIWFNRKKIEYIESLTALGGKSGNPRNDLRIILNCESYLRNSMHNPEICILLH
jgi:hypothetical protein